MAVNIVTALQEDRSDEEISNDLYVAFKSMHPHTLIKFYVSLRPKYRCLLTYPYAVARGARRR